MSEESYIRAGMEDNLITAYRMYKDKGVAGTYTFKEGEVKLYEVGTILRIDIKEKQP